MALKVGDLAPDFTLQNEKGEPVTLSKLRGKNVVLVFYPLDFSPICTNELRGIKGNAAKYAAAGAEVFGISVDSRFTHAAFKAAEGFPVSLLADFHPKGAVAMQYGVYMEAAGIAMRGTFVIDKNGILQGITVNGPGEARSEEAYFEALSHCPV